MQIRSPQAGDAGGDGGANSKGDLQAARPASPSTTSGSATRAGRRETPRSEWPARRPRSHRMDRCSSFSPRAASSATSGGRSRRATVPGSAGPGARISTLRPFRSTETYRFCSKKRIFRIRLPRDPTCRQVRDAAVREAKPRVGDVRLRGDDRNADRVNLLQGDFAATESTRSMSWIIRSRITSTSRLRGTNVERRCDSMKRGHASSLRASDECRIAPLDLPDGENPAAPPRGGHDPRARLRIRPRWASRPAHRSPASSRRTATSSCVVVGVATLAARTRPKRSSAEMRASHPSSAASRSALSFCVSTTATSRHSRAAARRRARGRSRDARNRRPRPGIRIRFLLLASDPALRPLHEAAEDLHLGIGAALGADPFASASGTRRFVRKKIRYTLRNLSADLLAESAALAGRPCSGRRRAAGCPPPGRRVPRPSERGSRPPMIAWAPILTNW